MTEAWNEKEKQKKNKNKNMRIVISNTVLLLWHNLSPLIPSNRLSLYSKHNIIQLRPNKSMATMVEIKSLSRAQ